MKQNIQQIIKEMYTYQARMVNGAGSVQENINFQRSFEETIQRLNHLAGALPSVESIERVHKLINEELTELLTMRQKINALSVLCPGFIEEIIDTKQLDKNILQLEALRDSFGTFVGQVQMDAMTHATTN